METQGSNPVACEDTTNTSKPKKEIPKVKSELELLKEENQRLRNQKLEFELGQQTLKAADKNEKEEKKKEKAKELKEPKPLPPIPVEEIDPNPISLDEMMIIFKKEIYVDEDFIITIPTSFFIGAFAPADPDCLVIVAPSGSSKTEMIRSFGNTENQYVYPLSSITSHTLITGLENAQDLAPQLRGRIITIKDFTTILSKNKDEVSSIFASIRDLLDGYLAQAYGSGAGKKEYSGLHSSILMASTGAIESYTSLYSVLGQRMVYFRPTSDPRKSRQKAVDNSGREKEIRKTLHDSMMKFINTILLTKKDRLNVLSQYVPKDMIERIGVLCEFLAKVRTHINRDWHGDTSSIPESEMPTRLAKTITKMVDAHSIIHDRMPDYRDEVVALRLVADNIPSERMTILNVLSKLNDYRPTNEIATLCRIPPAMAKRILEDLTSLGIIEKSLENKNKSNKKVKKVESGQSKSYYWKLENEEIKNIFILISNIDIFELVIECDRYNGVNWLGGYNDLSNIDRFIPYVYENFINKLKKEIKKEDLETIIKIIYIHLSESHHYNDLKIKSPSLQSSEHLEFDAESEYWRQIENYDPKHIPSGPTPEMEKEFAELFKNGNDYLNSIMSKVPKKEKSCSRCGKEIPKEPYGKNDDLCLQCFLKDDTKPIDVTTIKEVKP